MSTPAELRARSRLAILAAREQPDLDLKRLLARHALGLAMLAEKVENEAAARADQPIQALSPVNGAQIRTPELAPSVTTQDLDRIIDDFTSPNPGEINEAVGAGSAETQNVSHSSKAMVALLSRPRPLRR